MTKRILLFMTTGDEQVFSEQLRSRFSKIAFLDDNVWPTPEAVTAPSIAHCRSRYVYLWNRALFPQIPIAPRSGGGFQGPGSGPVAQFQRSIQEGNYLHSGRLDMGFNDEELTPELESYMKDVWKIIKHSATSKLRCEDPRTREVISPTVWGYWAWPDAVSWCRAESSRFLKDRATQNYYLPA